MSDVSEDAVFLSLNAVGQLEFRCKGLSEVSPIRLAAGAGNAYLLCLFEYLRRMQSEQRQLPRI